MDCTVRQRETPHIEGSSENVHGNVGDNRGDTMCLAEQKSIGTFLLALDIHLTKRLGLCTDNDAKLGSIRPILKILELSCHGIPWIFGNLIALFVFKDRASLEILVNLFFALILDVLVVAVIKLAMRRPRPAHNSMDMFATVSVDLYSFPSGHTTRAAMVAAFLLRYCPLMGTWRHAVSVWAVCVATSRVLLGRHHVGDVLAGVALGYLQYKLVVYLWLPQQVCIALLKPIL